MRRRTRKKMMIVGLVVVAVAGLLFYSGFKGSGVYYLKVPELATNPKALSGEGIRVAGRVLEGSITYDPTRPLLGFDIADPEVGGRVSVEHDGVMPDGFKAGVDVIIEGEYIPDSNRIVASVLLTKCPSKYRPKETA